MEDKIRNIIAQACLQHSDSGEASKDMEARRIMKALEDNGYTISPIKNLTECSNCNAMVEMISSGEFCPKCFC